MVKNIFSWKKKVYCYNFKEWSLLFIVIGDNLGFVWYFERIDKENKFSWEYSRTVNRYNSKT